MCGRAAMNIVKYTSVGADIPPIKMTEWPTGRRKDTAGKIQHQLHTPTDHSHFHASVAFGTPEVV